MDDPSGRLGRAGRLLSVVAVVALLVTAGCMGNGGGGTPTPTTDGATATPADGTTDGGDRTTDGGTDGGTTDGGTTGIAEGLPPGITDERIDGEVLLAAHQESLSGTGFRSVITANRTVRAPTGTRNSTDRQVTVFDGRQFLTTYVREGARSFRQATWGNDSVAVSRIQVGNRTQYQRRDPGALSRNLTGQAFVRQFLSMGTYDIEDVDRDAGRVTLRATTASDDADLRGNATLSSYEGTIVVDFEGRIRRMEVELTVSGEGGVTTTLQGTFEISEVGEATVERPDWVGEALSGSGPAVVPR